MKRRPSTQSNPGIVEKFIDTAFDELMIIVENLDMLKELSTSYRFSLIYLGMHTQPPATRLDGSPIQDGDYFVNSVNNSINFWDATDAEWVVLDPTAIFQARDRAEAASTAALASANSASASEVSASTDAATASSAASTAVVAKDTAVQKATEATTGAATATTEAGKAVTARAGAEAASQIAIDSAKTSTSQATIATTNAATAVQKAAEATSAAANAKVSETESKKAETSAWDAVASLNSQWVNGGPWDATAGSFPPVPSHNTQWLIVRPGTLPAPIGAVGNGDNLYYYIPDTRWYRVANPHAVSSVNGQQGVITLDAADVGAMPLGSGYTKGEADSKFYSDANKPSPSTLGMYSNAEIDAAIAATGKVMSVNGQTGVVTLDAEDVGALDKVMAAVMTKAEFDALRAKRKSDNAGSGFLEWGQHSSSASEPNVNEGMFPVPTVAGEMRLGRPSDQNPAGTSRTPYPIALVNGAEVRLQDYKTPYGEAHIKLPPAPDGTKTYDSATGDVVKHPDAATAFASETATNKVITSRQDLVFLETWHEEITEKDIVYPLGNVQYGTNTWEGINLSNSVVAQGYSAFGEWDTETKGYGVKWATLSEANQLKFLQDPENNIYRDGDKLIQVRYRIRVVEGLGDDWAEINSQISSQNMSYALANNTVVRVRGTEDSATPDFHSGSNGRNFYSNKQPDNSAKDFPNTWALHKNKSGMSYGSGNVFALPICLVPRLNQGAHHPVWNAWGCAQLEDGKYWYNATVKPTSTAKCFPGVNGTIASAKSGRQDQYKFYDAIYAGQVKDLRLSARVQDTNKLLEDSIRKSVAGEMRGWGKVPFTKVFANKAAADAEGFTEGVVSGSHYVALKWLSAEFDSLPWVDIIGSPERIAATFPNGVVGQWIPIIPGGDTHNYELNRKLSGSSSITAVYTVNTGGSWAINPSTIDTVGNHHRASWASASVALYPYETLSNFTEAANNSKVVGEVGDVAVCANHGIAYGNRLMGSTIGKVGTGGENVRNQHIPMSSVGLFDSGELASDIHTFIQSHSSIGLSNPSNNSPAVKTLYTLTEKDGLLYMQFHGNELKYKVDAVAGKDKWGDTTPGTTLTSPYGVIPIINGEGTKTNLNGQTVKTFCHHGLIPLGIASN